MNLLTIDEFKDKVKVHHLTVRRWIKKGMPVYQEGKVIRINEEEALGWLKGGRKRNGK